MRVNYSKCSCLLKSYSLLGFFKKPYKRSEKHLLKNVPYSFLYLWNNPRNPNKTILFGEQAIFHLIIFLFNNFSNTCFHKLKFLISLNPQLVHLRLYKKIQNDYATPESSQQFAPKQQEHTKLKKKTGNDH